MGYLKFLGELFL